ncbi:MAG: hypothetical protein A3G18_11010 [Rhodospirillales bacterium RIFCSPLOWO2_12_FULL_58_28]|nr:MAG: hypothetical protein A3H92_03560 [Rhodospirillales bacterium RIFCSPLOWO2_02_FULL_58_16]OHC77734.1 MAG: hypothetical protein A3G18_11010 [Rhodospirillales bacterium RIFCSPLOWO2_12_FULL_58_28]
MGITILLIELAQRRFFAPLRVISAAGLLFLLPALGVGEVSAQSPLQDSEEATRALFEAVRQNDLPAVQASITAGADINAVNSWGLTPADVAVDKGHFDVAHFLLSLRNFKAADSEKPRQTPPPQTGGKWGPVVTTNTAPPSPPPAPMAPVDSGPIQAEEAPAPQPTWPSDKPNPFDPGYVAPDAVLPIIGKVYSPKDIPLKAQALDVPSPAAPSENAAPPKGFLNKVTDIFKSAPAAPTPEPVIRQAEMSKPEIPAEPLPEPPVIPKVEAEPLSRPAEKPADAPAAAPKEAESAAPPKGFLDKMGDFFKSDQAKAPPSTPEMPAEPPAAATKEAESAAPSKGFLDKMGNFFKPDQAKAPPSTPEMPAEPPPAKPVESPQEPEDILVVKTKPPSEPETPPLPEVKPEETAPTKGFLKKMTDFFRPDESKEAPKQPDTTEITEASKAAPQKTPPEAPAKIDEPAKVAETEKPTGFLGKLNSLFAPPKPKRPTTEDPQTAPPPKPAPEGKESKEDAPEKKDWAVKGVETANVSTPLPVKPPPSAIPKNFLDNVELTLGQSVKLGSPLILPKEYKGGEKPCVEKKSGTVAFCIKPIDWPEEIEPLILVGTVMYSGLKSIVRYDEGKASRFHTLFPTESFEGIVAYHTRRFGPPTETLDRSIAPLAAQRRNNPTVMWQSVNPVTKQVTTLEIRKFDDTRGGFPDIERGAVMLYNQWSTPIFPQLSTVELMLLRPHEVM